MCLFWKKQIVYDFRDVYSHLLKTHLMNVMGTMTKSHIIKRLFITVKSILFKFLQHSYDQKVNKSYCLAGEEEKSKCPERERMIEKYGADGHVAKFGSCLRIWTVLNQLDSVRTSKCWLSAFLKQTKGKTRRPHCAPELVFCLLTVSRGFFKSLFSIARTHLYTSLTLAFWFSQRWV